MIELIQLVIANPGPFVVTLIVLGLMGGAVLDTFLRHQRNKLPHLERMAEIQARIETAKALAAAPEEVQKSELAQELLEAYGEAGEGLRNDEKGSLVRWESSKEDD